MRTTLSLPDRQILRVTGMNGEGRQKTDTRNGKVKTDTRFMPNLL